MSNTFPNTGTSRESTMQSTLSTNIIVKVGKDAVGAIQRLTVNQTRPLQAIKELGTDGIIELVPSGATTFSLEVERVVFDQLRLPEAFSRGFRFINAQRLPFDILVIDFSGTEPNASVDGPLSVSVIYKNCWFERYSTPYQSDNYIITETASIQCETAYLSTPDKPENGNAIPNGGGLRGIKPQTDSADIESNTNYGGRRGAMDASGLIKSIFG
jgi:hypothetical protein